MVRKVLVLPVLAFGITALLLSTGCITNTSSDGVKIVIESLEKPNSDISWVLIEISVDDNDSKVQDGSYTGWCVQPDVSLPSEGCPYDALMYNSYNENLSDKFTDTEQWDKINYVINKVSKNRSSYSYKEVQYAIWVLAGYNYSVASKVPLKNVDDIVDDANENGQGFEPSSSDDIIAYILYINDKVQMTIIEVPYEAC